MHLYNRINHRKAQAIFACYVIMLLYFWGMFVTNGNMWKIRGQDTSAQAFQQDFAGVQSGIDSAKNIAYMDNFIRFQSFNLPFEDSIEFNLTDQHLPMQIESQVESTTTQQIEEEQKEIEDPKISMLDSRLPAIVYLSVDSSSPTAPLILSDERLTDDDIAIDISNAIDSTLAYVVPYDLELCISRIVYREAGTQSPLGQLKVAEGVVTRLRSGIYGDDVGATLKLGYCVETDSNGNFHVYNGYGNEILDVPEIATTVTKLALQGSNTTAIVLEAATALRNEQFGLELGNEYYRLGAFYHYNPDLVSESALRARVINRVPVSYRYEEHVFYGRWLNANYALDIS